MLLAHHMLRLSLMLVVLPQPCKPCEARAHRRPGLHENGDGSMHATAWANGNSDWKGHNNLSGWRSAYACSSCVLSSQAPKPSRCQTMAHECDSSNWRRHAPPPSPHTHTHQNPTTPHPLLCHDFVAVPR